MLWSEGARFGRDAAAQKFRGPARSSPNALTRLVLADQGPLSTTESREISFLSVGGKPLSFSLSLMSGFALALPSITQGLTSHWQRLTGMCDLVDDVDGPSQEIGYEDSCNDLF